MKKKMFPHECCRCGVCCLSITCDVGMKIFGVEKFDDCPGLSFKGDVASCKLIYLVPFGDGCCIKAKAVKDGREFDFASLPFFLKIKAARASRDKQVPILHKEGGVIR